MMVNEKELIFRMLKQRLEERGEPLDIFDIEVVEKLFEERLKQEVK